MVCTDALHAVKHSSEGGGVCVSNNVDTHTYKGSYTSFRGYYITCCGTIYDDEVKLHRLSHCWNIITG